MSNAFSAEKITLARIEPASWWVGMKNPELQLLIYGENISLTDAAINIPGVTLKSTQKVENKNYLFLNIIISKDARAGNYNIDFIKDKKTVISKKFTLFDRVKNSHTGAGYNSSDVIYLIMPDRFSNGDPKNDNTADEFEKLNRADANGRHGGDIQGIINHLDYLNELGITAVWNTPLMEDNMENTSYHTYAITDYYRIDSRYGTNEDYQRLGNELHKRNMKLIMDVVTNHCGLNYYWMKDLPTHDWIHQFKEFTRSNYKITTSYDPYASEYDKNIDVNGWFDTSMPDLNQDNPLVLTYLVQNTIWWIEYAGLDGLRVDTYPYNSKIKIAEWTKDIRDEYPNINISGECWSHTTAEIAYWQTASKNKDGYDSNLPIVMDFPLLDVLTDIFGKKGFGNPELLYHHFSQDYLLGNPSNLLVFAENHDTQRFNEAISCDLHKYKMAYSLLFTIRGIPQIYYGSEILMNGEKSRGDGDIRRDFPGGWPNDTINAFTSKGRTESQNEAFNFSKKLINWRKVNPVIHSGKTIHFVPQNNCYVYFRYDYNKTVMVILNFNNTETSIDTKRFDEIMHDFNSGYDVISEKSLSDISKILIAPYSSMIIELMK